MKFQILESLFCWFYIISPQFFAFFTHSLECLFINAFVSKKCIKKVSLMEPISKRGIQRWAVRQRKRKTK